MYRLAALSVVFVLSCSSLPPAPPPLRAETSFSTVVAACAKLEEFGCPEAKPLPNGRTCVDVLHEAALDGLVSPACIASSKSVAGLAACRVRCVR